MPDSVTIRHVAREAGVAVSTVSRTLNASGPVREATRERVLAAAKRLGYVPNATARGLVRSRTGTIGLVLPFLTGEFYPEVVRGLDLAARRADRHLLLSVSHNTPDDTERALRAMHGHVDGLIVMTPAVPPGHVAGALAPGLPVVLLNAAREGHAFDVVSTDNYGGARLAVEHLAELGHERIAVIAGEPGNHDADLRLTAWRDVLAERGLGAPEAFVLRGDFSREAGAEAGRRLVALARRPDGPTAVFASSDYAAMGAITAATAAGLSVPGDLAFASFDDVPSASYFNPPLTAVHADTMAMGVQAGEWLLERIGADEPAPPRYGVLPARLEVRASSGPPR